jgi:hypothetical protein
MDDKGGSADPGQSGPKPANRRLRVPFALVPDITRSLSRSATIALLASPLGLIFIAVARLLLISNYNISTALAVASSGGYVNTLLGSVLPVVPLLLPYLALTLLFFNRATLGALCLIATLVITPTATDSHAFALFVGGILNKAWGIFAVVVVLLVLQMTVGIRLFARSAAVLACIILVPVVLFLYPVPSANSFYVSLITRPWLPDELITLTSGSTISGYMISDDQDWIIFLSNRNRRIYYYHPDQIKHREACQYPGASASRPLVSLAPVSAVATPKVPPCEGK